MHRSDIGHRLAPVLAVMAVTLGCTVPGSPSPEYADPATLDVGAYSVWPLDPPDTSTESYGRVLESVRMAEVTVDPVEVDPSLVFATMNWGVVPVPTPVKVAMFLAEPVRAVLEREQMLAGTLVSRTDRPHAVDGPVVGTATTLTVVVLRFPDAAAAERAARDIDAVDAAVNSDNVAVPIAQYPAAQAHWRPNVPTMAATIARDSYVVSVLAAVPSTDLSALTELAAGAFDRQLPRLADFAPTPRDQLAALPLDPDGMLGRTVPDAPNRWSYPAIPINTADRNAGWAASADVIGVVFRERGGWLWLGEPEVENHPERTAITGSVVLFRYVDAVAARRAYIHSNRVEAANDAIRMVDGPAGVADSTCAVDPNSTTIALGSSCRVLVGRYVAYIKAGDIVTARRKAAAQYGILVNAGA